MRLIQKQLRKADRDKLLQLDRRAPRCAQRLRQRARKTSAPREACSVRILMKAGNPRGG